MTRRFVLQRDRDVTGVSGTGVVAEGVEFSDGIVALRWCTGWPTSTVFHEGIATVEAIHGHSGATRIVWVDGPGVGAEDVRERPPGPTPYEVQGAVYDAVIDVSPEESVREGWHRATCELCDWYSTGTDGVVEGAAYEHITDRHPWEMRIAETAMRLRDTFHEVSTRAEARDG